MKPSAFKNMAWNGIQWSVPRDWSPSRIGLRHVELESETGPAMEVRWATVKGRFSSHDRLKRLSRSAERQGGALNASELPEEWRKALQQYEAVAFDWLAGNQRAQGVLVFCPICRSASLIQFFRRERAPAIDQQAAKVLASFRDHRHDGKVAWQMFDICAVLPAEFRLKHYRFEAGRFTLGFSHRRRTLVLYRWAPAELLLKDRTLSALAETVSAGAGAMSRPLAVAGHPGIESHDPQPLGIGQRLKAYAGIARFRRARLWHLKERNRILGVVVEDRLPLAPELLDAVCDGYGMADENS